MFPKNTIVVVKAASMAVTGRCRRR